MNALANAFAKAIGKEENNTEAPLSTGHRKLLAEHVVQQLPRGRHVIDPTMFAKPINESYLPENKGKK